MKISGIILNTFRESIRDKIFIAIIVFAVIVMGGRKVIQPLALGQEEKVIKDIGLNSITLFTVLIAILVGGRLVYKEIEKRTIYLIISRPIHRWQFIVGKYFGLLLVIFESLLIMACTFFLIFVLLGITPSLNLLLSILMTFFELWIITALAIFFSTFSTPITSSIFTFAVYFLGHLTRDFKAFAAASKSMQAKIIAEILYFLLPNLANFNIKAEVVHNVYLEPKIFIFTIAYAILYSAIILVFSCLLFQKKDF
ncbi:MAG: ABC transporter permease [candidate division WOR-3 bacterium]|nr:ABC transporter permease [candidate division WOR-3 bacterium]